MRDIDQIDVICIIMHDLLMYKCDLKSFKLLKKKSFRFDGYEIV